MIVDLYSGLGGWSTGLATLGVTDVVGIESDRDACATRRAAGHLTIQADATTLPARYYRGRVEGLVASPPCQQFSQAGGGAARVEIELTADILRNGGPWHGPDTPESDGARHVLNVGAWIEQTRPGWICLEQVPPVLPLWEAMADWLQQDGYHVWAGVLCAADYGVAQTRRRAILIASDTGPVRPPEPTHAEAPQPDLWGHAPEPWISMADALGWTDGTPQLNPGSRGPYREYPTRLVPATEPAPTLAFGRDSYSWCWHRPATTVCADPRISFPGHHDPEHRSLDPEHGAVRLTLAEALTLQGFSADFPVHGSRTSAFRQVGNAIPPPLAAAVVAAATAPAALEQAA